MQATTVRTIHLQLPRVAARVTCFSRRGVGATLQLQAPFLSVRLPPLPSWLTNKSEFASLAFSLLAQGGMNYDVTHSLLYFWAAKAIKINHHAAPQGTR